MCAARTNEPTVWHRSHRAAQSFFVPGAEERYDIADETVPVVGPG